MEKISGANLKRYAQLQRRAERQAAGLFLAEGTKLVAEVLAAGWPVAALVLTPEAAANHPPWAAHPAACQASPMEMARLSSQPSPEGALAVVQLLARPVPAQPLGPAFVLVGVQDPANLGALLRTAAWFGHPALYTSEASVDAFNPKAVRASMGAVLRVPVVPVPDLPQWVAPAGERLLLAALEASPLPATSPSGRDLIVLGSESHGLPREYFGIPGALAVRIPGGGGAESLNVAAAGAILAYSIFRQG